MGSYDQYKKEVLETSLWLSDHGYFGSLRGTGGNVSVRINDKDLMAVTPSSVKYHETTPADICIVDLSGTVVEGSRAPSVEAGMHAVVYRERPDVNAIVHTHQIYGSVFALLNQPIPALFDEVSFTLGESVEVALTPSPEARSLLPTSQANLKITPMPTLSRTTGSSPSVKIWIRRCWPRNSLKRSPTSTIWRFPRES